METARCSKKSIKHVNGKCTEWGSGKRNPLEKENERKGARERERDWESENESERIRIALLQQLMHIKVSILPFCSA